MRRFCFLKASSSHLVIVHYSGAQHYPFSNHLQHRGTRRKQRECPSDSVMHSALRNNTMIQHQPNETACVTTECNNEEFLHFWKASPGLVWMPRQLTSQLVCERKLKQLPSGPHEKNHSKQKMSSDIHVAAGTRRFDVTMPTTHCGIFSEKHKNKAPQMSEGHRVHFDLYPTLSANTNTISSCTYLDLQQQEVTCRPGPGRNA